MLKKAFIGSLCSFFLCTAAMADAGPFGLDWGASPADLLNSGVVTTPHKTDTRVQAHGAIQLPQGKSYGKAYSLMFDADFGLQRATLVSEAIGSDPEGSEGKTQYQLIKDSLSKQYGDPVASLESAGEAFPTLPHEFYPCIAVKDCGTWQAQFNGASVGTSIILELHGIAPGIGYITVSHEGPLWTPDGNKVVAGTH